MLTDPPAALCSPLPAGPTVSTIEAVGPTPAAAVQSPTVIRPDLYARYAAQRRAAAVLVCARRVRQKYGKNTVGNRYKLVQHRRL